MKYIDKITDDLIGKRISCEIEGIKTVKIKEGIIINFDDKSQYFLLHNSSEIEGFLDHHINNLNEEDVPKFSHLISKYKYLYFVGVKIDGLIYKKTIIGRIIKLEDDKQEKPKLNFTKSYTIKINQEQ